MSIAPVEQEETTAPPEVDLDVPWITLVWNDPVNLMSYVTYVFQTYFGYSRDKAEALDVALEDGPVTDAPIRTVLTAPCPVTVHYAD